MRELINKRERITSMAHTTGHKAYLSLRPDAVFTITFLRSTNRRWRVRLLHSACRRYAKVRCKR